METRGEGKAERRSCRCTPKDALLQVSSKWFTGGFTNTTDIKQTSTDVNKSIIAFSHSAAGDKNWMDIDN